jgi:sulfatase maturation enzyme AslB (radical SAM superfamily)
VKKIEADARLSEGHGGGCEESQKEIAKTSAEKEDFDMLMKVTVNGRVPEEIKRRRRKLENSVPSWKTSISNFRFLRRKGIPTRTFILRP